ncbi:immunoglobulin superfamily member 10 [Crotalus adamanteus]
MQRLPSRAAHLSGPPCKRGYRGATSTGVRKHPRGSTLESKNNKVQSILCSHLAGRMVGLKLLLRKMKGEKGNHPYVVGVLFGFFLAVFPGSSACPKLCACYVPTEVHCTFRYLTTVPLHISQNVERINLGYNNLVKLTETDFSGLEKLELLMLHSNQIHTIQEKTFSDLHSLKILKMSYNQIKLIQADTFHGLVALVRLHMDHNKIEFVNPKALYGLTSLKLVHLEGNLLKQLHPDTFVTLRYLEVFRTSVIKHIYLSDNFLTSLPPDIFSYMSELESLYLHGNPWTCDCALKWFAKWAERHSDVVKCKKGREATDALQYAFIPCEANGNPQPTIHWTKILAESDASKNRHHSRFEILPNGTLSIQNVNIQDRGQYLCVAANQQGSDKLLVTFGTEWGAESTCIPMDP